MKIKAKHILIVGAFIVLTLVGYILLPKDEIVIDTNEEIKLSDLDDNVEEHLKTIFVHIEGAVNSPGIKEVPKGTRIFEVIEMADGETADADISKINLASILKDEQKIVVPYKIIVDETLNKVQEQAQAQSKNQAQSQSTKDKTSSSTAESVVFVNLNSADINELQKLVGIGPSMAQKILDYREENGYFNSIEEIKNVSGIGEAKFEKIKDNISV